MKTKDKPRSGKSANATPRAGPVADTAPVTSSDSESTESVSFPIVGVGASAGGLEALTQLLEKLPSDTGMAFVLIQHLDPTHTSFLADAIARATTMTVAQAKDGERVEPNHIYVIPPDADIAILHGSLTLLPRRSEAKRSSQVTFARRLLSSLSGRRSSQPRHRCDSLGDGLRRH
jgi:two-component system CheB/CheR fusion protein